LFIKARELVRLDPRRASVANAASVASSDGARALESVVSVVRFHVGDHAGEWLRPSARLAIPGRLRA